MQKITSMNTRAINCKHMEKVKIRRCRHLCLMTIKILDKLNLLWYNIKQSREDSILFELLMLFFEHDKRGDKMKLGDIASVRSGLVLSRKLARENPVQRYRLLNLRSITPEGFIDLNETDVYDAKEKLSGEYLSQVGDVVIRLSAPYTAVLIDTETEGMVISSNFVIVRTDPIALLPEYLYWLLNTPEVKHMMFESSSSNMLGAIKAKFFSDYEITPLPIPEQQKIAAINTLAKTESKLLQQLAKAKEQYYEIILRNTYNELKRSNQI